MRQTFFEELGTVEIHLAQAAFIGGFLKDEDFNFPFIRYGFALLVLGITCKIIAKKIKEKDEESKVPQKPNRKRRNNSKRG